MKPYHTWHGNLHVNILKNNLSDKEWNNNISIAIREIFNLCVSLNGTLSGEHGIGLVQKEYMDIAFGESLMNIQKEIKILFDKNQILNPGKMFK